MRRVWPLILLLVACGDEETDSPGTADASVDTTSESDVSDVAVSDASDGDTAVFAPDAVADVSVDPSVDIAEDVGPACVDPSPNCQQCSLDFTGVDVDRPSTRVAQIANDAGVMRISNVYLVETPPLVQLSNSWIDYIDRVAPDWVPNETLSGFDSVGSVIGINAGELFEVQVAFNEVMDGPTGCGNGSCGTAVVEYELCDGSTGSETITISRR